MPTGSPALVLPALAAMLVGLFASAPAAGVTSRPERAEFMVLVATRTLLDPVLKRQRLLISLEREGPLGGSSPSGRWGVEPGLVRSASPLA